MAPKRTNPDDVSMHPVDLAVGVNLQHIRAEKGLSQTGLAELAKRAGLSAFHQTTIARIEAGKRPLRVSELGTLARALDVKPERLLDEPQIVETKRLIEIKDQIDSKRAQIRDATDRTERHLLEAENERTRVIRLKLEEAELDREYKRIAALLADRRDAYERHPAVRTKIARREAAEQAESPQ